MLSYSIRSHLKLSFSSAIAVLPHIDFERTAALTHAVSGTIEFPDSSYITQEFKVGVGGFVIKGHVATNGI